VAREFVMTAIDHSFGQPGGTVS